MCIATRSDTTSYTILWQCSSARTCTHITNLLSSGWSTGIAANLEGKQQKVGLGAMFQVSRTSTSCLCVLYSCTAALSNCCFFLQCLALECRQHAGPDRSLPKCQHCCTDGIFAICVQTNSKERCCTVSLLPASMCFPLVLKRCTLNLQKR